MRTETLLSPMRAERVPEQIHFQHLWHTGLLTLGGMRVTAARRACVRGRAVSSWPLEPRRFPEIPGKGSRTAAAGCQEGWHMMFLPFTESLGNRISEEMCKGREACRTLPGACEHRAPWVGSPSAFSGAWAHRAHWALALKERPYHWQPGLA